MSLKYVKSFDGLRGIGAAMILLYHWPFQRFSISHGWEFMQMFFVMSGYLITLVLLEEKNKFSFKTFVGRFYLKRALRLFPLYFAYLFAALSIYFITSTIIVTKVPYASDVWKHGAYLFTYTFNWMNIINFYAGWNYESAHWSTHLWTLSMEEQFYLVFPFLVFMCSLKKLRHIAIGAIIGAFLFRIGSYEWYNYINGEDRAWVMQNLVRIPFAQMDSFAFGAVIAIFPLKFIKNAKAWFWWITAIVVITYGINMAYVYYVEGESYYELTFGKRLAEGWLAHNYLFAYMITMVNAWCAILILYIKKSDGKNTLLENKILVWFGKLSYGFYLLHLPLLSLFLKLFVVKFWTVETVNKYWYLELILLLAIIAITTTITYLINEYYEKPFFKLKRKWVKKPS